MIKKILCALAVALPMFAMAQAPKFGTVNIEDIIPNMPEFTEAQTKLAEASKTYEDEYAKLNEELQKKFAEYQQLEQDPEALPTIKERRLQEIQEMDKKAQQFAQTAQQDLQRTQQQLIQPIQEKVLDAIKQIGAEQGFTIIYPEGSAAYMSPEVIDVTPMVKAKLNVK